MIKNDSEYSIRFFTTQDGDDLCIEHALEVIFKGDEQALQALIDERTHDTHYIDKDGNVTHFDYEREGAISFESFPDEYLKDGVRCSYEGCDAEMVEPNEDEEEEQEEKSKLKPFEYVYASWLPSGEKRIACKHVLCSDGKQRRAKFIGEPDTFFTQPAYVSVRNKSVTGFVWYDSEDNTVKFTVYTDRKNGMLLPEWNKNEQ